MEGAVRTLTGCLFPQERVINHAAGSHGVSGIFVKYDTSSLMVTVSEQHMPLWQFLVRLCGIVGGIFSTTGKSSLSVLSKFGTRCFVPVTAVLLSAGMLHGLVGFCFDVICCRFKLGAYRPREVSANHFVFSATDTRGFCLAVLRWRSNGLC